MRPPTDSAHPDKLIEGETILLELSDGQGRPVDDKRRSDDIDTAAIRKTGVADWARFVDVPADLTNDALTDIHQLRVVGEVDW